MREIFFASAPSNLECEHTPTILNVPVSDDNGNTVVESVDICTLGDSLKCLKYSDFEIQRLLASGVKLHSLNIKSDTRLGITDEMIDDYNERLESIASEMFNS